MPTPLTPPEVAKIAHGPVLIGFTFNAMLLGVMITQVYLYYTSFKNDKKWLKIYVAVLLSLDILNTTCGAVYLYKALILNFGNVAYLDVVTWLFDMDPAITGVIVTTVQAFFAWRIWVLTKSYVFPALIMVTAIAGGVAALMVPVVVAHDARFTALLKAKVPISLWLSAEVAGDFLITVILVSYLCNKHKSGFERSDLLVDRIIRITIQTGLITSLVALINLVVYLSDTSGLHLLFNFILAKLYSNSLMSTLNSRGVWMSGPSGLTERVIDSENQTSLSNYRTNLNRPMPAMKPSEIINFAASKHTEVFVNVESHELQDNGSGVRGINNSRKGAFDDMDRGSF